MYIIYIKRCLCIWFYSFHPVTPPSTEVRSAALVQIVSVWIQTKNIFCVYTTTTITKTFETDNCKRKLTIIELSELRIVCCWCLLLGVVIFGQTTKRKLRKRKTKTRNFISTAVVIDKFPAASSIHSSIATFKEKEE